MNPYREPGSSTYLPVEKEKKYNPWPLVISIFPIIISVGYLWDVMGKEHQGLFNGISISAFIYIFGTAFYTVNKLGL